MAETVAINDIKKSPNDDRSYRYIELPNKLKVVVIHDASADKAAAAMNVNIGASHDPVEFPGLAHFCEHMLFLGTEKYPEQNAYSKFLSEHAGHSNAYTSSSDTMYYFEVGWEYLDGALDRFAQFFHTPLFNQDCTDREVNAVNSENDKNLNNDGWRIRQLDKHLSDPDHPYSKFSTGNKKTLKEAPEAKGLDTREALLAFHKKYYSSNIMTLSILGRESLDELADIAQSKFATVTNLDIITPTSSTHPHSEGYLQRLIRPVPVKEMRSVEMCFPMKDQTFNFTSQPNHFLSHLVGHEGKGSLHAYLKSKGWSTALYAGGMSGETGTFGFFKITVELSELGLEHVDEVVHATFQYIAMLKSSPIQKWVFDECSNLSAIDFRFKENSRPAGYVQQVARNLRIYPAQKLLCADYEMVEFKPELVQEILDCLIPTKLRVTVVSKSNEKFDGLQTEPYYGTQYTFADFTPEQVEKWESASTIPELHYPNQNEFIATGFEVHALPKWIETAEKPTQPRLLQDSPRCKLWHKQDDTFLLPKGTIAFILTSPLTYESPKNSAMTRLFSSMFKDALNEFAYDAELAGIQYNVNNTKYGIDITVTGYHDKLPNFLYTVVGRLIKLQLDQDRFPLIKDNYERVLRSFKTSEPVALAGFTLNWLLAECQHTHAEILEALEGIDCAMVQAFIPKMLQRVHLEGFVYGNFLEVGARNISNRVNELFDAVFTGPALLTSEREHKRLHSLPMQQFLYRDPSEIHKICCVRTYHQVGPENVKTNALVNLFVQLIYEQFFEVLRTKEQLGYNVYARAHKSSGVIGIQFSVQSGKDPHFVSSRIYAFISWIEEYITSMSDEQFSRNVQALSARLLEKPKRMSQEFNKHWSEIINGFYLFDRHLLSNEIVLATTKDDVLSFYKKYISNDSKERRELTVQVHPIETGNAEDGSDEAKKETAEQIKDMAVVEITNADAFKKKLGLHALPIPKHHDIQNQVDAKSAL